MTPTAPRGRWRAVTPPPNARFSLLAVDSREAVAIVGRDGWRVFRPAESDPFATGAHRGETGCRHAETVLSAFGITYDTGPESREAAGVQLYRSGLTQRQVAERMGVSRQLVSLWVTAAGVEPHARPRKPKPPPTPKLENPRRAEAIARYAAGGLMRDIAADLGVARMTVWRWVRAAGGEP